MAALFLFIPSYDTKSTLYIQWNILLDYKWSGNTSYLHTISICNRFVIPPVCTFPKILISTEVLL